MRAFFRRRSAARRLTPVQQVVLAAIRIDGRDDARIRELVKAPDFAWDELVSLSLRQGVMPTVYERLRELAGDLVPRATRDELAQLHLVNAMRNRALAKRLADTARLLEEAGIRCATFKGPALAAQAYGDLTKRQTSHDLDLLVSDADVGRARELFLARGYTIVPQRIHVPHSLNRAGDQVGLEKNGEQPINELVEFHWAMGGTGRRYTSLVREWLDRAEPMEVEGGSFAALSPADGFIALCAHAAGHQWDGLRWIADLPRYLRSRPGIDVRGVLETAARSGLARVVAIGLWLSRQLGDAALPETEAERASTVAGIGRRVAADPFEPRNSNTMSWRLDQVRIADSKIEGILNLGRWACCPLPAPWEPRPAAIVYAAACVARPLWLAAKYLGGDETHADRPVRSDRAARERRDAVV